jgi:hypothetical protein
MKASSEAFIKLPRRVIESEAWRSLNINARRFLDFLMIEHMSHGGRANGKLGAPSSRRRAPSAGKITPPWAPIVRLPALDNALIIMGRHVEVHEVYSSVCSFRGEGEDQGRIRITGVKFDRAPGLDHQPLRDDLEDRTGERAIEGLEW